jgi:tetratricopeptide (TPR) repeat protein
MHPGLPLAAVVVSALLGEPVASAGALLDQLAALRTRPENPERLGAESRLLYFLAETTPDGAERERYHQEGLALAERALAVDPDAPAGLLWWSAHRGSQATVLNPFAAVRIAQEVEVALLRLRAAHPDYDHAAADRALGHLYQVAPRGVSVGSLEKAGQHLRAALERDAAFPANALAYAQLLSQARDCEQARVWATRVLRSPELGSYPLERAGWVRQAQKVLAGLDRRCRAEASWP